MRPDKNEDFPQAATSLAGDKPWWQKPFRMVQTNLRQTDAALDPKAVARQTREFGADILLFNIGGIYAFYPTDLELHERNPYLRGDLLGEMLAAARAEGLKLVGRFDMSKATRRAYEAHPDWFVHNRAGKPLVYNGTYQACVNGGWYQDYAHRILREALGRYDVDGVFFNMFGYRSVDYSGHYHGICVCRNCRDRFREMYGRDLPAEESFADPAYRDYLEFQDRTTAALADDIYRTIKAVNPAIAMTGHRNASDLIRMEVQRAVDRPQPEWPYQAGEQARWAAAHGQGKTFASTSAAFIDFAWRFVSETGACHELRFAQQLANGASLDHYLVGTFDQDDRKSFPAISRLFHWHRKNEGHYADLRSVARIGLYHSFKTGLHRGATETADLGNAPFRGAYRALLEARIPFDMVSDERVAGTGGQALLARYDAILMPNVACIGDAEAAALDAYVEAGGLLVATGETGFYDDRGVARPAQALAALPVSDLRARRRDMRGAYFRVGAGELPSLPDTGLLYLDGRYLHPAVRDGAETMLRLIPPQRFGPPELCFPDVDSDLPGVVSAPHGQGRGVYLPWLPDWLYHRDSLPDHRELIAGLIRRNAPPAPVVLEGAGPVELTVHRQATTGRWLVHLVNYSGQRNNLYEDPVAIHGLRLGIRAKAVGRARALVADAELVPEAAGDETGRTWLALPPLGAFEAISIEVSE